MMTGTKNGRRRKVYIYNVCDHAACYREIKAQAISYTTGVPTMIGAVMMLTGAWKKSGVHNTEEFDPDPFMDRLNRHGLPWVVKHLKP
jgi:saccharopine dehydrogenase (NAD+, L-lysine-forming)